MTTTLRRRGAALAVALLAAGCGGADNSLPSRRSPETGAAEVARGYYEALARKDWPAAYRALDAASRSHCDEARFARLGQGYLRNLGFEPTEVRVQGCDERGKEAVAHVMLKGLAGSSPRFYRDAVALVRAESGWAVTLPKTFGQTFKGK